ncbi:MAG: tetraacyldisaccharide 4'-kinase [Phycisphaerales bacterium]
MLEPVYRFAVGRRNAAFDRGRGVTGFDVPVISIGNLSVGGTGKTPVVRVIIERLRAQGRTPAIAMRGYKAQPGRPSDEQAEYADLLGDVPVVAQPDRSAGITELLRTRADIDSVVLDDGFQHRAVARDLDIVLIDATRPPFSDRCLPAGWLREPVSSLERADVLVLTRCDVSSAASLIERLRAYAKPVIQTVHAWDGFESGTSGALAYEELHQQKAVIACAIGHPSAFVAQCEAAGVTIEESVIQPDHHDWTQSETHRLEHLALGRDAIILTTGKDWVKLRRHARTPERYVRPRLRVRMDDDGSRALDAALVSVLG